MSFVAAYESFNCASAPHMVFMYNDVKCTIAIGDLCISMTGGSYKRTCSTTFPENLSATIKGSEFANITVRESCESTAVTQQMYIRADGQCRPSPMSMGSYYSASCGINGGFTMKLCSDSRCETGCESSTIGEGQCVEGVTASCSSGSGSDSDVVEDNLIRDSSSGVVRKVSSNTAGIFLAALVLVTYLCR